ncbi:MAG: hypothetical protein IPK99_15555 [Flavobacteriales bacterium]|nr:hypothetical protein [Flavobacteriales bacterium]
MNISDPRRNPLISGVVYALALVGTSVGLAQGWQGLVYLCKPLLMIVLSLWFFYSSRRVGDRFTLLVQAGLFFSLLGDVALMFQHLDEFNFLIGLAAFMMAQICYAMAFAQNAIDEGEAKGLLVSLVLAVLVVAYGFFFAYDLLPYLDEGLLLPVAAYAIADHHNGLHRCVPLPAHVPAELLDGVRRRSAFHRIR